MQYQSCAPSSAPKHNPNVFPVRFEGGHHSPYFEIEGPLPETPTLSIPLMIAGRRFSYCLQPDFERVVRESPLMFWLDGCLDDNPSDALPLQIEASNDGALSIQCIPGYWLHALASLCGRKPDDAALAIEYAGVKQQVLTAMPQIRVHALMCEAWVKEVLA